MIESIRNASIKNKNVLIRVDLNVPFEKEKVSDLSRLIGTIPTIKYIMAQGGRPILLSHFGRPKSKKDINFSLKKLLPDLIQILKTEIIFCEHLDGEIIRNVIKETPKQKPILLENSRFFDGEETNSKVLSKMFAGLGDLFCNDSFSVCHRVHASTVGVAQYLPSYSGLLLEKEISALENVLSKPKKPVVAIIGGSKVSTKIALLNNLIQKVDHIIIGGGMANTFLFAENKEVGLSILEKDLTTTVKEILTKAKHFNCRIHLPVDIVCASSLSPNVKLTIYEASGCPKNEMILDVGPKTVKSIHKTLKKSKTLIWNGPLGAFEIVPFNAATNAVALIASNLTHKKKLLTVAGGGDTVSALNSLGIAANFSYISNAGGAFLEWMEGKSLPGLTALLSVH